MSIVLGLVCVSLLVWFDLICYSRLGLVVFVLVCGVF